MFCILLCILVGRSSSTVSFQGGSSTSLHIDGDASYSLDLQSSTINRKLAIRNSRRPSKNPTRHALVQKDVFTEATDTTRSGPDVSAQQREITLREGVALLRAADIDFVAAYGTLLGIVRDGGMLKHDDDVDLIASGATFHLVSPALRNSTRDLTFEWDTDWFVRVFAPGWGPLDIYRFDAIDPLFARSSKEVQLGCEHWDSYVLPNAEVFPAKLVQPHSLPGLQIPIPNRSEDFLKRNYGPQWRILQPKAEIWKYIDAMQADYYDVCRRTLVFVVCGGGPRSWMRFLSSVAYLRFLQGGPGQWFCNLLLLLGACGVLGGFSMLFYRRYLTKGDDPKIPIEAL